MAKQIAFSFLIEISIRFNINVNYSMKRGSVVTLLFRGATKNMSDHYHVRLMPNGKEDPIVIGHFTVVCLATWP